MENVGAPLKDIGEKLQIGNVTDAVLETLNDPSTKVSQLGQVVIQLQNVVQGINYIISGNQLNGFVKIVVALRVLLPLLEPLGKEFARFISSVLRFAGGGQTSSDCGDQAVKEPKSTDMVAAVLLALDRKEDDSLRGIAGGVCRALSFAHQTMMESDKELSEGEVIGLLHMIDIPSCLETLGKITSTVICLMEVEPKTLSEEVLSTYSRRVIRNIDMYCHLAVLRDAVVLEICAVIACSGLSQHLADGIKQGLKCDQEHDRTLMKALMLPKQNQVRYAAFFDPDHWPVTRKFMDACSDLNEYENLHKVPVVMSAMRWENWFVCHQNTTGYIHASKGPSSTPPDKTLHNFVFLKKENSKYYYIVPQGLKDMDMYVVMTDAKERWVEVKHGKPGKEGEWNIFNLQDQNTVYMLSTREWPSRFMSMSDTFKGWIQGRIASVEDRSAHWIIQYNGSRLT